MVIQKDHCSKKVHRGKLLTFGFIVIDSGYINRSRNGDIFFTFPGVLHIVKKQMAADLNTIKRLLIIKTRKL